MQQNIHELLTTKATGVNGWRRPHDYHVTCLFVNRDEDNTHNEIYQNFAEDQIVDVEITGVVIVPSKLIVGVCFPKYPIDNKCPHVTLFTNEWKAMDSNKVLELTCLGEKKPF
jgi:hypothetical protein